MKNKTILIIIALTFIIGIIGADILSRTFRSVNLTQKEKDVLSNVIKSNIIATEYSCDIPKTRCFKIKAEGLDREYKIYSYKAPDIPMTDKEVETELDKTIEADLKRIATNKGIIINPKEVTIEREYDLE